MHTPLCSTPQPVSPLPAVQGQESISQYLSVRCQGKPRKLLEGPRPNPSALASPWHQHRRTQQHESAENGEAPTVTQTQPLSKGPRPPTSTRNLSLAWGRRMLDPTGDTMRSLSSQHGERVPSAFLEDDSLCRASPVRGPRPSRTLGPQLGLLPAGVAPRSASSATLPGALTTEMAAKMPPTQLGPLGAPAPVGSQAPAATWLWAGGGLHL